MATTIEQQPSANRANSALGPIVFRLSDTDTSGSKYRYVVRVKDSAGTELAVLRCPPNAADVGVFDVSRIMLAYLNLPLSIAGNAAPSYDTDVAEFYDTDSNTCALFKCDLGSSEAADAESAPVITYDHTDVIVPAVLFAGNEGDIRWLRNVYLHGYSVTNWRPFSGGRGWLSDISATTYTGGLSTGGSSGAAAALQTNATALDRRVHNVWYAANSTNGFSMGASPAKVKVSYYNNSTSTQDTDEYTLATVLGVAANAIDANNEMCIGIITGPKNWVEYGGNLGPLITSGDVTSYEMRLYDAADNPISANLVTHIVDADCYNGEPVTLCWVNQAGGWDYFPFMKKRVRNTKTDSKTFYKDAGNWQVDAEYDPYSDREGGTTVYQSTNQRSIDLNTDHVSDVDAELLESLFVSEAVFLLDPAVSGYMTKVSVTNKDYVRKTARNDRLKTYNVRVDYAKKRRVR